LRLPKSLSPEEKQAMVEEVIDMMHLRGCIDTKIGAAGEKRGVSGGERKRVSIAQELLTNPSLIFLGSTALMHMHTHTHTRNALRF
jgi:ABC-type multidrug transport system ATPase subunit